MKPAECDELKPVFEEAWKAGQIEAMKESMDRLDSLVDHVWGVKINIEHQIEELEEEQDA